MILGCVRLTTKANRWWSYDKQLKFLTFSVLSVCHVRDVPQIGALPIMAKEKAQKESRPGHDRVSKAKLDPHWSHSLVSFHPPKSQVPKQYQLWGGGRGAEHHTWACGGLQIWNMTTTSNVTSALTFGSFFHKTPSESHLLIPVPEQMRICSDCYFAFILFLFHTTFFSELGHILSLYVTLGKWCLLFCFDF